MRTPCAGDSVMVSCSARGTCERMTCTHAMELYMFFVQPCLGGHPDLAWLQREAEPLVHADDGNRGLLQRELAAWAAPRPAAKGYPAVLGPRCCLGRPAQKPLWQVGLRVLECTPGWWHRQTYWKSSTRAEEFSHSSVFPALGLLLRASRYMRRERAPNNSHVSDKLKPK